LFCLAESKLQKFPEKAKQTAESRCAIERGYGGIQPYLKALIEKDSGIEL